MSLQKHPLGEFDLIHRFFKMESDRMLARDANSIQLGIGDDCALLMPDAHEEIAITTDMLVEGRHFIAGANPAALGHKALAVNLSDLAAMGAKPLGFTLAIALPESDPAWLEAFSNGLFQLAKEHQCPLIGGDTTAGPLNICITAFGAIPKDQAIKRSGACVGDDIWVSGTVGDARLTLAALRHELVLTPEELQAVEARMHQPNPRVQLGIQLRAFASAALDISDGLLGDLSHILQASQKSALVYLDRIPKSATLLKKDALIQNQYAACGGDDYELCFTVSPTHRQAILEISQNLNLALSSIGSIKALDSEIPEITLIDTDGQILNEEQAAGLLKSFDHFA
jgi:thiamine-monophosphate kinase